MIRCMVRAIQKAGARPSVAGMLKRPVARSCGFILAGVEDVEAGDPEEHSGGEDEDARVERAADGDPCAGGGEAERESEEQMRPAGEALGVAIEEEHGEDDGGEDQGEAVEAPRAEEEERRTWRA